MAAVQVDGQNLGQVTAEVRNSLQLAVDFSFSCQQSDGHWCAPVSADATFTAQYVMFKYAIPGLSLDSDGPLIRKWLLSDQNDDGSWALAPKQPGNLSTSVEAYLALRLLDLPSSHPAMTKARGFILGAGGVAKVRFFTRFFLATFGLFPWSAIPQMPAELILMPTWATLNIYVLSSWARSTLIPILIVRHHEPVYALPNGFGQCRGDNNFLDEIWCDASNKNVPFARDLWGLSFGRDRDVLELFFTLGDRVLVSLGGLRYGPQRKIALRKCTEWLLSHQEEAGDWAGFFPPIHGSVWALLLEGFALDHQVVRLGLEALERLAVTDDSGKWLQSTVSPCWDTALMINALCDAGAARDERVRRATAWLTRMQLMVDHGDWRVYSRNTQAGGWSFEYHNTFYPDVDDTAVVVMSLVKQDPSSINSDCVSHALEWILGMQNRDGGWGAFDTNNDARWLHKIPFSDMDSLVDPSTSDVTGRMLECFGLVITHREGGNLLSEEMRHRLLEASKGALSFLLREQEEPGSWWGRWGNNFNYGTTNVLRGLVQFCHGDVAVLMAAKRAVEWLESCQNSDGGWGEDLLSYRNVSLAGHGPSTAAHTAWALDSLLRYRASSNPAIEKGIQWLVKNQTVSTISRHRLGYNASSKAETICKGASWPIDRYVGTGFPNVLYLGYPFYHHLFPIQALSRYLDCSNTQSVGILGHELQLKTPDISDLSRPSVLMMVLGSRGDIEVFLSIAKRLAGCRIRIATHPAHRGLVEKHRFQFYDVGGSPDEFSRVLGQNPNVLSSIPSLRRSLCKTFQRFWQASIDSDGECSNSTSMTSTSHQKAAVEAREDIRPFVADVIVSSPASNAHVHAAEMLKIPLVLVSPQPALPTAQFPHYSAMTRSSFSHSGWWNILSYFLIYLLNWLAFGTSLNNLRTKTHGLKPFSWVQATKGILQAKIPHICLWSCHVLPRPPEWAVYEGVTIRGFSSSEDASDYKPRSSLETFISDAKAQNRPIVHISFGSMAISDPTKLLTTIGTALEKIQATAIICRSWSISWETDMIPPHIYTTGSIPHSWLLPRVDGFVHHGGAGHTAAGVRAGVPQLVIPFFLDQYLWAARVRELGLGPAPIEARIGAVTAAELARSLEKLLYSNSRRYRGRCAETAAQVLAEGDGADAAADLVLRQLGIPERDAGEGSGCCLLAGVQSCWRHVPSGLRLCGASAACLVELGAVGWGDLDSVSRVDWDRRWEDASMARSTLLWTFVFALGKIVKWLTLFASSFHSSAARLLAILWVGDSKASLIKRERIGENKTLDLARQARIRQGEFDLLYIRRKNGGKDEMDQLLVRRWRSLVAARFHQQVSDS